MEFESYIWVFWIICGFISVRVYKKHINGDTNAEGVIFSMGVISLFTIGMVLLYKKFNKKAD